MSKIKETMYKPKEKNILKLKEYLKKQDLLINMSEIVKKEE